MDRYARQIMLPEIGHAGQQRLSSSRVAVVGAGGLGSSVLYHLASAGVGHIQIIDSDVVDITNLNRQFIHFEEDVNKEKSQSAKSKLLKYNHDIRVNATTTRLDESNVGRLISNYDIIISCADNCDTRRLINCACVGRDIAMIDGGAQGFEGYVMSMLPGVSPCYQCIFPKSPNTQKDAEPVGILGATVGVIGSMMAVEAIKRIIGIPMHVNLHYIDLLSFRITPITAVRNPACSVCANKIKYP